MCYKGDKNCLTFDSNLFVCKSCSSRYYLNNQNYCILMTENCLNANLFGTCLSCVSGYSLSINNDNICYLTIPSCNVYNSSTRLCQACAPGFILNSGYCYKIIDNCLNYNFTTIGSQCLQCKDTYSLNNNLCISCGNGYYIDFNGVCKSNPTNCKSANKFGQCLNCITNYTLYNNNLCVA